jgi:hypothetical protein
LKDDGGVGWAHESSSWSVALAAVLATFLAGILATGGARLALVSAAFLAGFTGKGSGAEGGEGEDGEDRFHVRDLFLIFWHLKFPGRFTGMISP